ncbi:MAG: hypothetical protein GX040_12385 [Alcaligenaceae bacterium]|nr:hypothetical protein [Alcaligenaceae bacterium]
MPIHDISMAAGLMTPVWGKFADHHGHGGLADCHIKKVPAQGGVPLN